MISEMLTKIYWCRFVTDPLHYSEWKNAWGSVPNFRAFYLYYQPTNQPTDVSCKKSEAIRDVEQTTGPSAKLKVVCFTSLSARCRASKSVKQSKLKALPYTTQDRAQDAQKTPMFN